MEEHSAADRHILFQVFTLKSGNGVSRASNVAETTIKFISKNDQPPVFTQDVYYGNIDENEPAGSSVGVVVVAMDTDIPSNPNITYSIHGDNMYIQVDPSSGVITTLQPFDAETLPYLTATVTAHDASLTATATVNITINDVNDNPPQFQLSQYNISIRENASIGSIIYQLQAIDNDRTKEHSTLTYAIHTLIISSGGSTPDDSSEDDHPFSIDNLGQISVSDPLNAELMDSYILEVTASDGVFYTDTIVYVTVTSVNDNPPVFINEPFSFTIPEDTLPGASVYNVHAVDNDEGDTILYSIHGAAATVFTINKDTGDIYVALPLDYESASSLTFTVVATDTASHNDSSTVSVTITNVNDNQPTFNQSSYTFTVDENTLFNTGDVISAYDIDGDTLTYSLEYTDAHCVVIDPVTGQLSLISPLDYELTTSCELRIIVSDGAFTGTVPVSISVRNVNDNSPVFDQEVYSKDIPEALPIGSLISIVSASDGDINDALSYSLLNESDTFNISSTTGEIRLASELDFESVSSYNLTILAQDNGAPSTTGTTQLRLTVINANDEIPIIFLAQTSIQYIEESGSVAIAKGIEIMDGDNKPLSSAIVTLQLPKCSLSDDVSQLMCVDGNTCYTICGESLSINTSSVVGPITISQYTNGLNLHINVTGQGTVSQYKSILSSLSYSNYHDEPTPGPRTITIRVDDGEYVAQVNVTVNVEVVNDSPIIINTNTSDLVFVEGMDSIMIGQLSGIQVSDIDQDTVVHSLVISLDNSLENELISAEGFGGIVTSNGIIEFKQTASLDEYQV